jgi:hypothetical protein
LIASLVFLGALIVSAPTPAPSPPAPNKDSPSAGTETESERDDATTSGLNRKERHAAARISGAAISARIRFLADDLLEGREPGTRGDELATKYLAAEMESIGLEPGAPTAPGGAGRSFIQSVPIVELKSQVPETISFASSNTKAAPIALSTRNGEQAELVVTADAHVDKAIIDNAELVFVGYGIQAPEYGWDDYKDVDVKGKIVVLLNFNPPFKGEVDGKRVRLWYGRWDYKYQTAAAHGAIGALIIHSDQSAGYPWRVLSNSAGPEAVRLDLPPEPGEPRMQFRGWLEGRAAEKLFKLGGASEAQLIEAAQLKTFKPVSLNQRTTFNLPTSRRIIDSANVIGLLPGTEEALRNEAVVFSAHHDHLGVKPPVAPSKDGIYNGALDNASGCAAVMAIAQAAMQSPARRSLLFVFTTGEEEGLLGARWFAQHPTFPAGRLAANINIDVINVLGKTTDLTVLGLGKSSMDELVRAVAKAQHREVHADASPDKGGYYRSDHFALARVGVPSASVSGGPNYQGHPAGWGQAQHDAWIERDYHQVTDEFHADWDLSGAIQDAQLQLIVGLRAANATELPKWTPGDEFEAARRAAAR